MSLLHALERTPDDPRVLHDVAALFGLERLPDDLLTRRADLILALSARIGASEHHPKTKKVGGTKYVVHNAEAASLLRAHWSAASLEKTIAVLQNHGTFEVTTDP